VPDLQITCPNCSHVLSQPYDLADPAPTATFGVVTDTTPPLPPPPPPPPPIETLSMLVGMSVAGGLPSLKQQEALYGRKMMRSTFQPWGRLLPADFDKSRPISINVKMDGLWASIAAGAHDVEINAMIGEAKRVAPFVLYVRFGGEADRRPGLAADYVRAFRRIRSMFNKAGVTNVVFVWSFVQYNMETGSASPYYPGDSYVDALGPDGYNWHGKSRSFATVFAPTTVFAKAHNKTILVTETACRDTDGDPARAQWIDDASDYLAANLKTFLGLAYFNTLDPQAGTDWRLPVGSRSEAAWKRLCQRFS
jgi:hypothetical protein